MSNMTMEELFNNRRLFKAQVTDGVQKELDQFGLRIYNANVKELQDMGESKYFESLARKAQQGAQSQAQVDVAHALMVGQVGAAEKEGQTKQQIAKINAQTAVLETERKVEKANADQILRTREIEIARDLQLDQIAANRMAERKDAELQKGVEEKRAAMELERLRATKVTQAQIDRESSQHQTDAKQYSFQKEADAAAYSQQKQADGNAYNEQKEAEAEMFRSARNAEAAMYKRTKQAEAELFSKEKEGQALFVLREKEGQALLVLKEKEAQANYIVKERDAEAKFVAAERQAEASYIARKKEADGLKEMASAYGELSNVLGGPQGLMQYLMLQNGTFEKLAHANATAINGLQPKINVWNTGSQDGAADSMAPIRNLIQTLPPMLSTIQEQTGMTAPSWLMGQPQAGQNGEMSVDEKAAAKQKARLNGRH